MPIINDGIEILMLISASSSSPRAQLKLLLPSLYAKLIDKLVGGFDGELDGDFEDFDRGTGSKFNCDTDGDTDGKFDWI